MILSHIIALFVDLRATADFIEILIVIIGAIFAFVVGRLKSIIPLILDFGHFRKSTILAANEH